MPEFSFTQDAAAVRWIAVGAGGFAFVLAAGFLLWRRFRKQLSPAEIERLRREMIHRKGKIGDGEILDVDGAVILYTYSVAGVEYTVGQDASAIEALLPEDRMRMLGPASVRFDPKNPPNSIVLCEAWSGLRLRAELH